MSRFDDDLPVIIDQKVSTAISTEVIEAKPVTDKKQDIEDDYTTVRNNLKDLTEKGQEALETAIELAGELEAPQAFETVGNMIKSLTKANQALLDVHKQIKDLESGDAADKGTGGTTHNTLIMSTEDVQKIMRGEK